MKQRESRKILLFIVTVCVAASIIALGSMQYLWVNRASEAEESRLQRSLRSSANQVLFSAGEEIRVLLAFLYITPDEYEAKDWRRFNNSLRFWRANAQFPELLDAVYLIPEDESQYALGYSFEDETFRENSAPERLVEILRSGPKLSGSLDRPPEEMRQLINEGYMILNQVLFYAAGEDAQEYRAEDQRPGRGLLQAVRFKLEVFYEKTIPHYMSEYLDEYLYRIVDTETGVPVSVQGMDIPSWEPELTLPLKSVLLFPWHFLRGQDVRERSERQPTILLERFLRQNPTIRLWLQNLRTAAGNSFSVTDSGPSERFRLEVFFPDGPLSQLISARRFVNLGASIGILLILVGVMVMLFRLYRNTEKIRAEEQEFVMSMSHELRTPIAVLQSTSENLKEGVVADPSRVSQYSSVIYNETRRLSRIVEGILLFSGLENRRHQNNQIGEVNLGKLAQQVIVALRQLAHEHHAVITIIQPSTDIVIHSDQSAIRLIVENLLMNAIRHGLAADRTREKPSEVRLKIKPRILGRGLIIVVEDDGPGISHREAKRVFEPFFRSDASIRAQRPGSGLGLHLVNRITRILGGTIRLASPYMNVVGRMQSGCRFTVELPDAKRQMGEREDTDR
jgi:signal transduction histidine kinase